MKTLTDDQRIRTTQDQYRPTITIHTVEGEAIRYGKDPEEALELNAKNAAANKWTRYDIAFAMKHAACLDNRFENDNEGRLAWIAKEEAAYAACELIENGEHVMIRGREYKVRYTGPQYSDPLHFDAVKQAPEPRQMVSSTTLLPVMTTAGNPPKSLVDLCRKDGRITDVTSDSDGYWLRIASDWCWDDGIGSIHEYTVKDCKFQLGRLQQATAMA